MLLHSKMSFSVEKMMFSPESILDFSLTQLFNLFSGQWQVCWTIIRRNFSSGAFGVHATARYLVVLIWVYENNGHFAYFNLIISSISYLYFLHLPIDAHLWSETLLYVIWSLSLIAHVTHTIVDLNSGSQIPILDLPILDLPILGALSRIWNQQRIITLRFSMPSQRTCWVIFRITKWWLRRDRYSEVSRQVYLRRCLTLERIMIITSAGR